MWSVLPYGGGDLQHLEVSTDREALVKRPAILLVALLLVAVACTSDDDPSPSTTTTSGATPTTAEPAATTTTAPTPTTSLGPVVVPVLDRSFGTMTDVPLLSGGSYSGESTPSGLTGVYVPDWVDALLDSHDATSLLGANGFVVIPSQTRHFHHIYEGSFYEGWPVYLTTDAAYHVWHLAFDKILREAEQQRLLPALEEMVARLVDLARAQEGELAGTELEEAANRVTQYYEAAAEVLEIDVGPIGPLAQQEADLIMDAAGLSLSPTTGGDENSGFITTQIDYSLFRPRGHYTRNGDLERYFRAMSQLGNNAFLLNQEALPLAVLASRVLLSDPEVGELWELIYGPTAWLVGAADDYTPFELGAVVEQAVPTGWTDLTLLAEPASIDAIARGLLDLRPVAINPEAASIRIMGSRFVIDSYILDQLVMPEVQREEASPVDIAAAFGSEWAIGLQTANGTMDVPGYAGQLDVMQQNVSERSIEDWSSTVYDAWLYAITPMWQERGDDYPAYMQSDAWAAKSHQTGFGSYTELKHDTILYTKQAVAEGGGDEPPVPPRHWVEPEPVAYERLAGVTALMREGLTDRDLLPDEYGQLLVDLEDFYNWLGGIARDELAGIPVSEEDNQELGWIGSTLEGFWVRTSDSDLSVDSGPDAFAALVADVMRNPSAVLELGTGFVDYIFVVVPDDDGGFQVATGGVYSYYEFWNTGPRLTDGEWRSELEAGTQPARPEWQQVFLPEGTPPTPQLNVSGLETGLFCRDLASTGYGFFQAVSYWLAEGSPDRMDADGNGIPCETVFPGEVDGFLDAAAGTESGLLCADLGLSDDRTGYQTAVAYWLLEGAPVRMDEDGNGIPCETVFSPSTVKEFLTIAG